MKKQLLCSLFLLSAAYTAQAMNHACGKDEFGHTFFSVPFEYLSGFPIQETLMRNRSKVKGNGAYQFVPFGGQSNGGDRMMKFFAPVPKTELIVDSDPMPGGQTGVGRDINPIHFGISYVITTSSGASIPGRFKSTIRFRPQRTVGGLGFTIKHYFGKEANPYNKPWYVELSAPVMHVRNKMHLHEECDCAVRSGFPAPNSALNMIDAFTGDPNFLGLNQHMQFGLINDASSTGMSKTGSVIELKLGRDFLNNANSQFDIYLGFDAPIGNVPNAVQMFEAVPSFNRNFGMLLGGGAGFQLWRNNDSMLILNIATIFRYFIRNRQVRSFDLIGRKWSRYMIVRNPNGTISPGINLFTQPVTVRPRASTDINIGVVYDTRAGVEFELGYNFFARQGEEVCLRNSFPTGYATVGFNPITLLPDPTLITLDSNIASNGCPIPAPGQPGFIPGSTITEKDLNLLSAAHPAYQSNQIYISLGSIWNNVELPTVIGIGASYIFSGKNTALNRWLVWAKVGISI